MLDCKNKYSQYCYSDCENCEHFASPYILEELEAEAKELRSKNETLTNIVNVFERLLGNNLDGFIETLQGVKKAREQEAKE